MIVRAVKTDKILPDSGTIFDILDKHLDKLEENTVVVITSKIVAICEGRTVPIGQAKKEELIIQESEYFLPKEAAGLGHRTITSHTLVSAAGIDESNTDGNYVLLPKDSQKSANDIRIYLKSKYNLLNVGVLITDSISTPLRLGASGVALGWSGFSPLKDYRGKLDIFGRPYKASRANIAGGLAATATLIMGEGAEQTPIAIIEDLPFIEFQDRGPVPEELEYMSFPLESDLFAPFLESVKWQKGYSGIDSGRD